MHGDTATHPQPKNSFSTVDEYLLMECPADANAAEVESLRVRRVSDEWHASEVECVEVESAWAAKLTQQEVATIVRRVPGGSENICDIQPLSPYQEGMLLQYLLNEQSDTYVLSALFELSCDMAADAFTGALQRVVDRRAELRSVVVWEGLRQPLLVRRRRLALAVERLELDAGANPLEQLERWMRPGRARLDLRGEALRLQLTAPVRSQRYAILHVHSTFYDRHSFQLLLDETLACVQGRQNYLSHAVDYQSDVQLKPSGASPADAFAFFRARIQNVDEATAPFRLTSVQGDGSQFRTCGRSVEANLAQQARAQASRIDVTTASLFHAVWALVVAQTSERDEVTYGTVLSPSASQRSTAGAFDSTLPLTLRLSGVTVQQFVQRVHIELRELSRHLGVSLKLAQSCSAIRRNAPLFAALLEYRQPVSQRGRGIAAVNGVRVLAVGETWANHPVRLVVEEQEDGFVLTIQTDGRIDPQRILGYADTALRSVVEALESAPDTPMLSCSVLPSWEREQVVHGFNATQAVYSQERLIHELFEEQAQRTPHVVALVCEQQSLTYAQLNGRANRLARLLRAHGVGPDQLVGTCVERGVDLIVGWLGILKAGGAYVPLDPTYPPERLAYMLKDAQPRLVLTQRRLRSLLPVDAAGVLELDGDSTEIEQQSAADLDHGAIGLRPHHLAYVIYTSGSTGQPKGVMIEHGNFVNVVHWNCHMFDLREGARCSCVAAVGFDAATWEILPVLCAGATLVVAASERTRDVERLLLWWTEQSLDTSFLPTPLAELAFRRNAYPAGLSRLCVGGDQLRHRPAAMSFALINNYGPTESTVVATSGVIHDDDPVLHIGRPIANSRIYILDNRNQPVPIGVAGELYIGGTGVARGYLNRPDLTAERFVADPFSNDGQGRLYKTGDLGRWREDGTIEYLGRNDDQVKVRGYRIELGEIESQLRRHEQVSEALVVARESHGRDKNLVAYFTQRDDSDLSIDELRAHLSRVLPTYMVPGAFVRLVDWPLTTNGKIDRRALPEPDSRAYVTREYTAPCGEVERTLAEIWQDLLGTERVGRDDDFFELGGHSLVGTQVAARIESLFCVEISIQQLFASPTLRDLAAAVDCLRRARLVEALSAGGTEVEALLDQLAAASDGEVERLLLELRPEGSP